jgi:hypothetical protein
MTDNIVARLVRTFRIRWDRWRNRHWWQRWQQRVTEINLAIPYLTAEQLEAVGFKFDGIVDSSPMFTTDETPESTFMLIGEHQIEFTTLEGGEDD